jgi:hypothetical protein
MMSWICAYRRGGKLDLCLREGLLILEWFKVMVAGATTRPHHVAQPPLGATAPAGV